MIDTRTMTDRWRLRKDHDTVICVVICGNHFCSCPVVKKGGAPRCDLSQFFILLSFSPLWVLWETSRSVIYPSIPAGVWVICPLFLQPIQLLTNHIGQSPGPVWVSPCIHHIVISKQSFTFFYLSLQGRVLTWSELGLVQTDLYGSLLDTTIWLTWCGLYKHLKSSWKRSTKRTYTHTHTHTRTLPTHSQTHPYIYSLVFLIRGLCW